MNVKVFRKDDGKYRLATPCCVSCGFHTEAPLEDILDSKGYLCKTCKDDVVRSTLENILSPRRKIIYPIKDCEFV